MVKEVIRNLDLSKASGSDCIPVLFLRNCESELSCILAELFNMCQIVWTSHQWSLQLRMLGKELKAINYYPFNLLSVVSKFFKKLVNYRLVGHLVKHGLLSNFQCGFRSSRSTAENLLYLVPDNIARAFNRSGATRAVALDRSTVFDKV